MMSMHAFEMTTCDQTRNYGASEDSFLTGGLHAAAEDVLKPCALGKNFNVAGALTEGAVAAFFEGRPQNLRAVLRTFSQKGFFKKGDFADGISHLLCNAIAASYDAAETLHEMGKFGMMYKLDGVEQFPLNNMLLCYATRLHGMETAPGEKQKFARVIDAVLQVGTNWDFLNAQAIRTAFDSGDRALLRKFHDAGANFENAADCLDRQEKTVYDPGWVARKFLGAAAIVTKTPSSQATQLRDLGRLFTVEKEVASLTSQVAALSRAGTKPGG